MNTNQKISLFSKWSLLLGNLFEHYDTALFSLLSPFLAPLFFPGKDPLTALILTYAIIPLGMLARPIGSLVIGYIGDTKGRKTALILTLSGMGVVTGCMGLMPTYQQVGFLAPVFLSFGRLLQNFFGAGETMGGAIYLIENSPEQEQDVTSGFYSASTVAGILLASFGVSLLCTLNCIQDYWRLLYFLGCSTAAFACFLRMKTLSGLSDAQILPPSSERGIKFTLKSCWNMRYPLFLIAIAAGFSYASYTLALVMLNGLIPLISSITEAEMLHLNTFLLGMDFLLLPLFGYLANQFSREKMMMSAAASALLTGFPLFWGLQGASLYSVIFIRFILVVIGVWFAAPFHAWAQNLIPRAYRYTVISFAYAIGCQVFGGPSAAISLWLFQKTGWTTSLAWYWMFLGSLTSFLIAKQIDFFKFFKKPLSVTQEVQLDLSLNRTDKGQ